MTAGEQLIFETALCDAVASLGLSLSDAQRAALWRHRQLVINANRRFNLTRIIEPADFAVKHHADSLSLIQWCNESGVHVSSVLDVGTGAGVPAIPLGIAKPEWRITAIDGTEKKIRFVVEAAGDLLMDNVTAIQARAEQWRTEQAFDLVLFKAVGSLERCLEVGREHVAPAGHLVVYKTAGVPDDEKRAGEAAARRLGFGKPTVFEYDLPLSDTRMSRTLWIFRQGGDQSPGRDGGLGGTRNRP